MRMWCFYLNYHHLLLSDMLQTVDGPVLGFFSFVRRHLCSQIRPVFLRSQVNSEKLRRSHAHHAESSDWHQKECVHFY